MKLLESLRNLRFRILGKAQWTDFRIFSFDKDEYLNPILHIPNYRLYSRMNRSIISIFFLITRIFFYRETFWKTGLFKLRGNHSLIIYYYYWLHKYDKVFTQRTNLPQMCVNWFKNENVWPIKLGQMT